MATKTLLITGATGKQGGSVIAALSNNPLFHLLAVTRSPTSASAQALASSTKNLTLIKGDLEDVPALFETANAASETPIWGVFSVQISQGKGVTSEGEIRQGKALIDGSVKAGVRSFVYSSVDRGGDVKSWEEKTPVEHFATKWEIEQHLRDSAGEMGWTILRPVAFMDNLAPGFPTKVFMAALRDTIGTKPMQWIATADIGIFAKLAFEKPAEFNHQAISLAGDELTVDQLAETFEKATGSRLEGTFWFFGSFLKYMVADLGAMINWFGSDGYGADIKKVRSLHPGLLDLETWIQKESAFVQRKSEL